MDYNHLIVKAIDYLKKPTKTKIFAVVYFLTKISQPKHFDYFLVKERINTLYGFYKNNPKKYFETRHMYLSDEIPKNTDFLIEAFCEKLDKLSDDEVAILINEYFLDFVPTRRFKKVVKLVKKYEKYFEPEELKEFYNLLNRYIAKGGSVDNVIL